MQLLEEDKNKGSQFFKKLTGGVTKRGFFSNLKSAFTENAFISGLFTAGAVSSVITALTPLSLFGLLPLLMLVGQIAGGWALNNAIRGNAPIGVRNSQGITAHMITSAIVLVGGLLLTGVASHLWLAAIFTYFTHIVTIAGLTGLFEAGIEKYRRK